LAAVNVEWAESGRWGMGKRSQPLFGGLNFEFPAEHEDVRQYN
jgi:hypothetical protein